MSQMSFDDVPVGDDLYVIGQGGGCSVVKIGRAINPAKRLGSIQTGNPNRLFLLHIEPGAGALERDVHARLSAGRLEGEWFDLGQRDPVAEVQRVLGLIRNPPLPRPRPVAVLEPEPVAETPDDMLGADETAWNLSITTQELGKLRADGGGPPWSLGDSGVRYRRGDLVDWIQRLLAEQRAA